MKSKTRRLLIRNFLVELLVYAILLVVYFLLVLRFLGAPLNQLFHLNPVVYAGASLLLIVVQGVALEWITSFLVSRLGLEKLE
ncbi:MAG: hypothetical protein H6659_06555 [Ardenticatenaceae bacterium]|nr:hypothetical protein [Anaerolineales bacterium]MCB8983464.1 hypothetical protein [Ardenticatenaceae bacterium]